VGISLRGIAKRVRVLELPGLPEKGDIIDWADAGGTSAELLRLVSYAPEWQAPNDGSQLVILNSKEFVADFKPPEYFVDGMLQVRFCYAITAKTGGGKTAIALLLAYCVAMHKQFAGYETMKGRVLYFAGENPDDVRMRWLAMAERLNFDVNTIDVHWIVGTRVSIANDIDTIKQMIEQLDGVDLVIIDTGPAYFDGVDENNNTEMGEHARKFRALTTLGGGPCVLVLCHPVKHAKDDNLLPRGGGAFLAEVDGNIGVVNDAGIARMFHDRESCGKFRGAEFHPLLFEMERVTAAKLVNRKGARMPTVIAKPISEAEVQQIEDDTQAQGMAVLRTLAKNPNASFAQIANLNGWRSELGPHKSKVARIFAGLSVEHLVKKVLGRWQLTDKAHKLLADELKKSTN
jgi:hypothetical protein